MTTSIDRAGLLRRKALEHAVDLDQCSLHANTTTVSSAMTEAADFMREVAAALRAAPDPKGEAGLADALKAAMDAVWFSASRHAGTYESGPFGYYPDDPVNVLLKLLNGHVLAALRAYEQRGEVGRVVPAEPDEAMIAAGVAQNWMAFEVTDVYVAKVYRAMLAATPQPAAGAGKLPSEEAIERARAEGVAKTIAAVVKAAEDLEGTCVGRPYDNGAESLGFDRALNEMADFARALLSPAEPHDGGGEHG